MPKFKYEEEFKSIKANIVNHNIIYQLNSKDDIIVFYKKSNLNIFNRLENAQNAVRLMQIKSDMIPKRLARDYANGDHDFNVYVADEFIFIVYSQNDNRDNKNWIWNVLLYDTKRKIWSKHKDTFYKSYGGIYGFYYLKKCRKVVLTVGRPSFSEEVSPNIHDSRRGFNLRGFYVIHLTKTQDNKLSYTYIYVDSYVWGYMRTKYTNECARTLDRVMDYAVDVNNGIIYIVCKTKCLKENNQKAVILALEYDLCSLSGLKSFGIELPIPLIEHASGSNNVFLYLSDKRLKDKGMPKYLPVYISGEFYDFMSNKLFHADMVFSSHSKLLVKDRYFNRVDGVLSKIESLKVATHIPLQEDIITLRSGYNSRLLAVLIMNDLSVVKSEDIYKATKL